MKRRWSLGALGDSFQAGLAVQVLGEWQQPVGWRVVRGESCAGSVERWARARGASSRPGAVGMTVQVLRR